jgi:phenylalanyl-tRNA synthetase beta chain
LQRGIDLVGGIARIHGYDKIPDDVPIPVAPSFRKRQDSGLANLRQVLAAAGMDEAVTVSIIDEASSAAFSPWSDEPPLRTLLPVLRGCQMLRRSLVPSLLQARQLNQALGNAEAELYEIARVYLPQGAGLPREELMLAIVSGRDFWAVKGVVEAVLEALRLPEAASAETCAMPLLDPLQSCCVMYRGQPLAYIGAVMAEAAEQFKLRGRASIAEVRLEPLVRDANLTPTYSPLPQYPAIARDLNLVVDEQVRWADVAHTVREACGPYLERLEYRDTYRDPSKLGEGKKSLLFSISLRWAEGTMTNQQADQLREQIVAACNARHGAQLRQ